MLFVQAFLLLIILSISMFGAVFFEARFEDTFPVTCMTIVFILFCAGLINNLLIGVYLVYLLSASSIAASTVIIVHNCKNSGVRSARLIVTSVFTPAFFIFLFLFAIITFCNYRHRVIGWDELTHWATVVKQMVSTNTFGCDMHADFVVFKSYPPAVSLFQFFVEKTALLFNRNLEFCDWLLYFAYQLFSVSFVLPFIGKLNFKCISSYIVLICSFLSFTLNYTNALNTVYVDPFIGLVSGSGLAMTFMASKERDKKVYRLTVIMEIALLVLIKDVGILFSAFLALTYIFVLVLPFRSISVKRVIMESSVIACAVVVPKALWKICVYRNDAGTLFGAPIDFNSLVDILQGKENSYRIDVIKNYLNYWFSGSYPVKFFGVNVPVMFLLVLLLSGAYLIYRLYVRLLLADRNTLKLGLLSIIVQSITFSAGMLIVYMYKFPYYEAVELASVNRYLGILYNSIWFFFILSVVYLIQYSRKKATAISLVLLCLSLSTGQVSEVGNYLQRIPASNSISDYNAYRGFFETVQSKTESDSRIYFVSQWTTGYDYWITKYYLFPRRINPGCTPLSPTWSIGVPKNDNDVWTMMLTAEQWRDILVRDYDYVAIYKLNDYFLEEYSELFMNSEEIGEQKLYIVDKTLGRLILQ